MKDKREYRGDKYGKSWGSNESNVNNPSQARRWMTLLAASITVRDISNTTSRMDYRRWHDHYKPVGIPKFPERVYKDWNGWNEFLGVENTFDGYDRKFGQKYEWREFWSAVRHVQGLHLTSRLAYLKLHREGGIPKDIPMAPDELPLWRDRWVSIGWNGFLGKTLTTQMEAIKNVDRLLSVCFNSDYPANVLEIITSDEGIVSLEHTMKTREELKLVKTYVYPESDVDMFSTIVNSMGSQQGKGLYLFANVNAFLSELDHSLLMYR